MSFLEINVVDELAHFLEVVGWVQKSVLREEGLRPLHIAFMRRAGMYDRVSYSRMAKATRMPKEEISRAGEFLVKSGLATVKKDPRDRRSRLLRLTKRGKQRLGKMQLNIAKQVLEQVGASSAQSKRFIYFTVFLWNVNRFLPDSRVANPDTYYPSPISPSAKIEPDWPPLRDLRNTEPPRPPESNPWRPPTEW
jgi:DNA-binding MarR family transcriptional regulator